MELQQIRYVLAVAQERNFTRAAQRCFVVQSALSHQIKALESELGVALFARSSRRVELTAAGEAFLPAARACLDAADRAVSDAAAAVGEIRGTLTIGVISTVTALDVAAALGSFRDRYPAVRITLRDGGSDEFIAAIGAGEMDVAVLGLPETMTPRGIASRELLRERLVAALPAGHRLAQHGRLHLADLVDEEFVDFPEGTAGRVQSEVAFEAAGMHRRVAFEARSIDLMLDLVRRGLVVALLPHGAVPDTRDLRPVPVVDGPPRTEYLAWSGFNPSPAARAFVDGVESAIGRPDSEHRAHR